MWLVLWVETLGEILSIFKLSNNFKLFRESCKYNPLGFHVFTLYENKLGSWWRDLSNNNMAETLYFQYVCHLMTYPSPQTFTQPCVSRQPGWQYWGSIFDAFFFPISSISLPSTPQQVVASKKPRSLFPLLHLSPSLACLRDNVPLGATWGMTFKKATYHDVWGFPGGSVVKIPPAMQETQVWVLGREDPLEEGMATHSSILAGELLLQYYSWRIPWTEPGRLQFVRSQRVGHDWSDLAQYDVCAE